MQVSLWLIVLGTLVSEDLACIATGVLVSQHKLGLIEGTFACLAGIFAGDMLLFLCGRLAGSFPWFRHQLNSRMSLLRLQQATAWFAQRGMVVVLLSRFTPGLRLPTYVAAGLLGSRPFAFAGYLLLASAMWTPLLVAGTALIGEQTLKKSLKLEGRVALLCITALVILWLMPSFRLTGKGTRGWRLFVGFVQRKLRWEFWPMWAAYFPLIPYLIFLSLRHRSLTLFTAANPGIPSSGFVGESKSAILEKLSAIPDRVAEFALVRSSSEALEAVSRLGLNYPVVLKPDSGERGVGVSIVRSVNELRAYFANTLDPIIVQRYISGLEFGVFYVRFPYESRGRIVSITEKLFPTVTGDGRKTLWQLILQDSRAVCLAQTYRQLSNRSVDSIPAIGEQVRLVEIGSHCRGAIFLDATHLNTPSLEESIESLSQAHPGFYMGRYDLRTPSLTDLQSGNLKIIELNGVSAEATHIYDPSVNIMEAYRVMCAQWRIAFKIGAINRTQGVEPMSIFALLQLLHTRKAATGRARPAITVTTNCETPG